MGALPLAAQEADCTVPMTQLDLNFCAAQEWGSADAELDAANRSAITFLKGVDAEIPVGKRGGEVALRVAQRAWITYRDRACEAEGFLYQGGSIRPMIVSRAR